LERSIELALVEFADVDISDLIQAAADVSADSGQVPEYIAQLQNEQLPIRLGKPAAFVADKLLDLFGHFASLTDQAEYGVDRQLPLGRINGRQDGSLLILAELHDQAATG
jgi:hypothetical protein